MSEYNELLNSLEEDIRDYIQSYFDDETSDLSSDGIYDFLYPLCVDIEFDLTKLEIIVQEKAVKQSSTLQKLENEVHINANIASSIASEKRDIRHTNNTSRKTVVDAKALKNAERKLKQKAKKRNGLDIEEWNPSMKPEMVVNQQKSLQTVGSKDIKINNFDIQFAGNKILENANLTLAYGRRYGLVGKNGAGKSTLLNAISSGELLTGSNLSITHVEQELVGNETTAIDSVLQADTVRENLLSEEKALNAILGSQFSSKEEHDKASLRLKQVYSELQDIESDKAESKAAAILVGLGFSSDQHLLATKTFSGGWRMRLALARALFCRPDLLLADEVTNHLDFPAVVWLENYLCNWKSTLLVVSHDRSFLDSVCTDMLHLHDCKLDYYKGSFSDFIATRAEKRRNEMREYEAQLEYRQHLQDFIDRWRYNAKRAPQAQMKIKILEKLDPLVKPSDSDMEGMGVGEEADFFKFNPPESLSVPILQLDEVTFGYQSSRIILNNVSLDIGLDSKIGIVGPNGAGKSTLVNLLTGQLQPLKGICNRNGRLRLGYFSQHHVDQLELPLSSVAFLEKKFPGKEIQEYRRILGRFGLRGTVPMRPIGTLSGGQKSRVMFAFLSMLNPHVLILDEPSNHLDMDTIDILGKALVEFKGGVCIVSHDQAFLDAVCNEIWICDKGQVKKYLGKDGDPTAIVSQYKKSLIG